MITPHFSPVTLDDEVQVGQEEPSLSIVNSSVLFEPFLTTSMHYVIIKSQ